MYNHILIVDDDDKIRNLLKKFLINNEFIVTLAPNCQQAEIALNYFVFDLIILDVMMPVVSGIDFLKVLKGNINTPVIMLTALGNVNDRINGLECGADDYLAKPFEPKELLLRIKKLIHRTQSTFDKCKFGNYIFNIENGSLKLDGKYIHLTNNESKLMRIFALNASKTVNRDSIVNLFEGSNLRTIDVMVARLRSKIEKNTKTPSFLHTIRNQGYILWGKLE